jgi:hypothetical protein
MNLIKSEELITIFTLLNEGKLNYILMRNINNEIPSNVEIKKDIDILVKYQDKVSFINFFKQNNFQQISHPHKDNIFLYGVNKFEFFVNSANVLFDLNFQIAVRSLDAGQWIPLDQSIQESAWKHKRFEQLGEDLGYWTLSYEDEFVSLVARSIFDKKEFQSGYRIRINELVGLIDKEDVVEKLNMVFFKFTPYLLSYIEQNDYENIIKNYLEFKEY